MLFDIPAGTPPIYWRSWNLIPNIVSIIVYIVIGLFSFRKKEKKVRIYHKVKVGYGIVSIFYGYLVPRRSAAWPPLARALLLDPARVPHHLEPGLLQGTGMTR
nr:hypothetical protein [Candidatus Sigynarchaeum springense]